MKNKIAVFSGTTEGKNLINFLANFDVNIISFVATKYGSTLNKASKNLAINSGRLTEEQMEINFSDNNFDFVIDCTHPYAIEVTKNIKLACKNTNTNYIRVNRDTINEKNSFQNAHEAATYLKNTTGKIFLSTGSKDLETYSNIIDKDRLIARILPLENSFKLAHNAGILTKQIIAMYGPFSFENNLAQFKSSGAKYLITKQTGNEGGIDEKTAAAAQLNVKIIYIGTKNSEGKSLLEVEKLLSKSLTRIKKRKLFVIGMGVGDNNNLTIKAKACLDKAEIVFGSERLVGKQDKQFISTYKLDIIKSYLYDNSNITTSAILVSGDVGFYSLAKNIDNNFEEFDVEFICGISSFTYFFSKIKKSYEDVKFVSSHGRNCNIVSLVNSNKKTFTLLGNSKNIIEKFIKFNLTDLNITIGENLGSLDEKITIGTPLELLNKEFSSLSVMLIENNTPIKTLHLSDDDFDRAKVPITKSEIRDICLGKLNLSPNSIVYDIGSGSGGMTISMAKSVPYGFVYGIEKNPIAVALSIKNSIKNNVDNVEIIEGTVPEMLKNLPKPSHIFIGGSSGNLKRIIDEILSKNNNAKFVATAVTLETISELINLKHTNEFSNFEIVSISVNRADEIGKYNLMKAQNQIYIATFNK